MKINMLMEAFLKDNNLAHFFDYNSKKKLIKAKCVPLCTTATYDDILNMLKLAQDLFKKIDINCNIFITNREIVIENKGRISEAYIQVDDPDFEKKIKRFYFDRLKRAKTIWIVKTLSYDTEASFYDCTLTDININVKTIKFTNENDAFIYAKIYEDVVLSIYQTKEINLSVKG